MSDNGIVERLRNYWCIPELIGSFTRVVWPVSLNIGLAFVGGLTAYTIAA